MAQVFQKGKSDFDPMTQLFSL